MLAVSQVTTMYAFSAALLTAALLAGLVRHAWRLRGTTLRAAWWWTVATVAAVASTELVLATTSSLAAIGPALRYTAAAGTFCPMMAVLGARRPQNGPWQLIVLSLWLFLLVPAVQWWLYRPAPTLDVPAAWRWFLLIQLGVALVNYLPTRYGAAVFLATIGQSLLISRHLPIIAFSLPQMWDVDTAPLAALAAWTAAVWSVHWINASYRLPRPSIDRVWTDFRDLYGAVWAVRVCGRMNACAQMYEWPLHFDWQGMKSTENAPDRPGSVILDDQLSRAVHKTLRTALRRFVSSGWIAQRLMEQ